MYIKNYTPDLASVLADVVDRVRDFNDDVDLYLDQIWEHRTMNCFPQRLGIHNIVLNSLHSRLENQEYWPAMNNRITNAGGRWSNLKNDIVIGGLRSLIRDCSLIRFSDWAKTADGSDFWYGLFLDVIKPLNKRDFEFIFHPGDISKKLLFEIDEFLDIMGDYASYGRVTLTLDQREADQLWNRFNTRLSYATSAGFRTPDAEEKYLFLFNTMSIDVLLIIDDDRIVLLSRDGQLDLTKRSLSRISLPVDSREYFNEGYQLGLLLHLGMPHCVALGLAVSDVYKKHTTRLGSAELLAYISERIEKLQPKAFNT